MAARGRLVGTFVNIEIAVELACMFVYRKVSFMLDLLKKQNKNTTHNIFCRVSVLLSLAGWQSPAGAQNPGVKFDN